MDKDTHMYPTSKLWNKDIQICSQPLWLGTHTSNHIQHLWLETNKSNHFHHLVNGDKYIHSLVVATARCSRNTTYEVYFVDCRSILHFLWLPVTTWSKFKFWIKYTLCEERTYLPPLDVNCSFTILIALDTTMHGLLRFSNSRELFASLKDFLLFVQALYFCFYKIYKTYMNITPSIF